jgi:hypothetical protein
MNVQFQFATATRIVFGAKVIDQAGSLAKEIGSRASRAITYVVKGRSLTKELETRALVVMGRDGSRAGVLLEKLK